ncbi:hypothetical protein MA16_Dca022077 [Dendrobium catenatum]|uniref:Retrovirus-related Pol polyprotein from transposon TNT 1-94-like beta-barrel domain-containing protein n=1 Tax=Dendrobium catenatum TaxID=906689 RepID=A0A2I0WC74_9ASPA|nr:hypothetical protein MA16_Dca022077 [Dendrobium catenatum]
MDYGASSHMMNLEDNLSQLMPYKGSDTVTIGDGRTIPIAHSGTGILPTPSRKLHLYHLLHLLNISHNLISISNLIKDNDISITFDPLGFFIQGYEDKSNPPQRPL